MTITPSSFQALPQFAESYLNRPLRPEERLKLQNFHNRALFQQQSRLLVLRRWEEFFRQTQAILAQLLESCHEIQKALAESEKELSASLPEASGDNGGLPVSGNSGAEKQE